MTEPRKRLNSSEMSGTCPCGAAPLYARYRRKGDPLCKRCYNRARYGVSPGEPPRYQPADKACACGGVPHARIRRSGPSLCKRCYSLQTDRARGIPARGSEAFAAKMSESLRAAWRVRRRHEASDVWRAMMARR